jgi:four helix bundle protein
MIVSVPSFPDVVSPKLSPKALQERFVEFGAAVCEELRRMERDLVGTHLSRQLVRCATSPAANYAEACGAESRRDFIHKLKLVLKELRESLVWLQFVQRMNLSERDVGTAADECNELIAMFVKSVATAKKNRLLENIE